MKKLISTLLSLALMFSLCVVPAGAEEAALPEICEHCGVAVEWTAWSAEDVRNNSAPESGHYYVAMEEDSYDSVVKKIADGVTVCLYLNGKTLAGTTRAINVLDGGTLNIMGEGTITGRGTTAGVEGACAYVAAGGTLNQYGGTLSYVEYNARHATNGGVVYVGGTYNLYDGVVENGMTKKYHGGNVYVASGGAFNMYDGEIRNGTAEYAGGNMYVHAKGIFRFMGGSISGGTAKVAGNSVYHRGTVYLSGNSSCNEIFLKPDTANGGPEMGDMIVLDGDFSGDVTISTGQATVGLDVGNVDGGSLNGKLSVLDTMLVGQVVDNDIILATGAYCEHCKKDVIWQALEADETSPESGHYYAASDMTEMIEKYIYIDRIVCVHLNGKTVSGVNRAFSVYSGGTLNIMGDGTLSGCGGTEKTSNGGAININEGGTLNLYSGTLTSDEAAAEAVTNGGIVNVSGTFNMYGGLLTGGLCDNAGPTVFVETTGVLNVSGGSLEMGTVGTSSTSCVYNRGTAIISGDADVAYLLNKPNAKLNGPVLGDMLIVRGDYTGTLGCGVSGIAVGMDIGNFEDGSLDNATVTMNKGTTYKIARIGNDAVITKGAAALLYAQDGTVTEYADLQSAVDAFTDTSDRIVLLTDVTDSVAVSADIILDLNGNSITGQLTGSGTLRCRDSRTDDYTISDGCYGAVVPGSCTVEADNGYMAVTVDETITFHKFEMALSSISLRQSEAGVYLTATFGGDEVVSANVESFGVVLNAWQIPTAENMETTSLYSQFDASRWECGSAMSTTGTMLTGIMKQSNTPDINSVNGQMNIFGKAYVKTADGYIYSDLVCFDLRDILEQTSENWDDLTGTQKQKTADMYGVYASVMEGWSVDAIRTAKADYDAYAAMDKTASQADISVLEGLYKDTDAYHGELHDHAATGGTSDGKQPLEVWKTYMDAQDIDFAAIVDHRQVLHMQRDDWDNTIFVGGSEASTTITDREGVKLHYNMTFADPAGLEAVLYAFEEFNYRVWTEEDREGCGGQLHFNYPTFTAERFTQLCEAIRENGGFLSIVHPKATGYVDSENPEDAWFADFTGVEVFYTYGTDRNGWISKANYGLWTGMLAADKKVYATAGNDAHDMPSVKALSTFYSTEQDASAYVELLRSGNFCSGPVGIRMCVGDTAMGGTTDFTGKRLVFSVGDFHESVYVPTHTYRVDLISDEGIVFSQEISCEETSYFAIDAEEQKFYRVEVHDTTENSLISIGNPIWNN